MLSHTGDWNHNRNLSFDKRAGAAVRFTSWATPTPKGGEGEEQKPTVQWLKLVKLHALGYESWTSDSLEPMAEGLVMWHHHPPSLRHWSKTVLSVVRAVCVSDQWLMGWWWSETSVV